MNDDVIARMRERAEQHRRLAGQIYDRAVAQDLLRFAADIDDDIKRLEQERRG